MPEYGSVQRHPLMSLFYLVIFIILGYALSSLLAIAVLFMMNGGSMDSFADMSSKGSLLLMQSIVSIGSFIAPPLALSVFEKNSGSDYLKLKENISVKVIILTIVLMFG